MALSEVRLRELMLERQAVSQRVTELIKRRNAIDAWIVVHEQHSEEDLEKWIASAKLEQSVIADDLSDHLKLGAAEPA